MPGATGLFISTTGNVAEWATGIVAGLALYWAMRAAKAAEGTNEQQSKQLQHQAAQLANLEEDKERSQAEKIAAWHEGETLTGGFVGSTYAEIPAGVMRVRNASDVPIYRAAALVYNRGDAVEYVDIGLVPPGTEPMSITFPGEYPDRVDLTIAFQDAAGRGWKRDRYGQLHHLSSLLDFAEESNRLIELDTASRERGDAWD